MVQRYEQTRKLQWYKRGAAYENGKKKMKGGEGLNFTIHPRIPSIYRLFWRAGEG